jgi:hypothetical protein
MPESVWMAVDQQRPKTKVEMALKGRTHGGGIRTAVGWLSEDGRWVLTAEPKQDSLLEITHWCELPDTIPPFAKGDPVCEMKL